ncbi:hypothetical protein HETIRDRAFT_101538 [Heterobasidion irregulare TC 32-1]|uniref:Uncharacterized protein n=1 Tax=Heterobasidion irregulare (strain TC 32-1) TaxID=747525 RepID=W4K4U0_HETIT|nr:uncharacterized protein HETIRDRAFT_101538 [Heterobasidion irregulare TC 32-1]ETW80375.1 hypothetical protein HETIRDRAFT_101538 [Heterobasidion irregulare TC 32-1]
MSKRQPGQTKNALEIQLEAEEKKVDEIILRERKKAHLEWETFRRSARREMLEIEARSKERLADEKSKIEEVKIQAMGRLSKVREGMDEALRQLKSKHEREWSRLTGLETDIILEREREMAATRTSMEEEAEEKIKDVKAKLKAENDDLYGRFREAVQRARAEGRKRKTDAVEKWFEEKNKRERNLMLAKQTEAEASGQHREWERRAKSKGDESKRRTAEKGRKICLAGQQVSARAARAWAEYEDRWRRIKSDSRETVLLFRDIPWPTLKTPYHAFDIEIDGIHEFVLSPNHSPGMSVEARLNSELMRWDEDVFAYVLSRVAEADKTQVELGAILVRTFLEELLERSETTPSMGTDKRSSRNSLSSMSPYRED